MKVFGLRLNAVEQNAFPMRFPLPDSLHLPAFLLVLGLILATSSCSPAVAKKTEAEPLKARPVKPSGLPMWLGNVERNFYGSGPWPDRPLKVVWEFETELTSGRFHNRLRLLFETSNGRIGMEVQS